MPESLFVRPTGRSLFFCHALPNPVVDLSYPPVIRDVAIFGDGFHDLLGAKQRAGIDVIEAKRANGIAQAADLAALPPILGIPVGHSVPNDDESLCGSGRYPFCNTRCRSMVLAHRVSSTDNSRFRLFTGAGGETLPRFDACRGITDLDASTRCRLPSFFECSSVYSAKKL